METNICLFCGKPIHNRKKYCNNHCQFEYEYMQWISEWKEGKHSGVTGEYGLSNYIKRYIFEKYNSECAICHWSETNPYTGKKPLEIEHIDGNYLNNKEENLILLCPNCHSLTATAKGANRGYGRKSRKKYWKNKDIDLNYISLKKKNKCVICGKPTNNKYSCSKECEHIRRINNNIGARPHKEILIEDLKTLNMVEIGKKYNVSDNAVRKWCKIYNLPYKKKDIEQYF